MRFPAEILTDVEINALVRACSNRAPTGVRNRALLILLHRSGLRIGEALSLRPKDLDAATGSIRVLHGKGNKARTVGMDAEAFASVDRWLDAKRKRKIGGPIFSTLRGKPIKSPYVRALLPRLANRAGITKRVHAHGFRHSHAARLAAGNVPINIISRQLGHSNIGTTSRYLDHIAPGDVIAAVRSLAWGVVAG
jgi:integrase